MVQAMKNPMRAAAARKKKWIARVAALIDQTTGWAREENWSVDRGETTIYETLIGEYAVPTLRVRLPGGEVHIRPVGLDVVGADGRVDMEAFPALNRVKLILVKDKWVIYTDSNVPLEKPWKRGTFSKLARDLVA